MVLLHVSIGRLANGHGGVLVGQRALLGGWNVLHQLGDVWDFDLLEEALFHGLGVVQLGVGVRPLQHGLHLGHALGLAEDVRIRDGNDVGVALKVFALDFQILDYLTLAHLIKVPAVQAAQDLDQTRLRLVQPGVDGRVDRSTLLDQRLRGAHRGVAGHVSDFFLAGGHYPLGGVVQPAQKLKEHRRRWIERHGHGDFADVVHTGCAFYLCNLRHLNLLGLAADLCALELEHRGRVVDMGRIQQRAQGTRQGCGEPTNQVGQANGVSTAPWDELELDDPIQLGHRVVALFPVTVQADDLGALLVHHHDVRSHLTLGKFVVVKFQKCVDMVDLAQAVVVVLELLALDLVVGLLRAALLGLLAAGQVGAADVHAAGHAPVVFPLGDLVDLSRTLGGVEVGGRKGQDHPVDGQELHHGALLLLVVPELQKLRSAQW